MTDEQTVAIPREADRTRVAGAGKNHKLSDLTLYAWRKQSGQREAVDVKRLCALNIEHSRWKELLAEAALDIDVLKEINSKMVSSLVRCDQFVLARERGLSQRRASGLLTISRSAFSYGLRLPVKDAPVIDPTNRWAIARAPNTVNKSLEVLLLKCLLDGGAYAVAQSNARQAHARLLACLSHLALELVREMAAPPARDRNCFLHT